MRADIDAEAEVFPDLLARSVEILRDLFGETFEVVPEWARPLSFTNNSGIRHRRFDTSSVTCSPMPRSASLSTGAPES